MRPTALALVAAASFAFAHAAWAVNKCTGPDGAVVFQDAPCPGQGQTLRIMGAGQANPQSEGAQYWQREAARQQRTAAVAQGKVAVGMTADEVHASWGKPTRVNKTISASGTTEQWVYRRSSSVTQYVYLQDGKVRTIQSPE